MKRIVVVLTVLCLVFTPLSVVQAQSNGDIVRISMDFAADTVYISTSDSIVLYHGWGACTQGLVRLYLNAVHIELSISDETGSIADGKDQFWMPITEVPDAAWLQYCVAGDRKSGWVDYWEYPLGELAPGEYEVYYYRSVDHQIIDGTDTDGDGRLETWEGLMIEKTFTIVVE